MIDTFKKKLHYLFIPSEKNNFRAKTLHHDFLMYYLVLAFVFVFVMRNYGSTVSNVLGIATDITVEKLNEYTNEERQKNNLSSLSVNEKLSTAAYKKAEDMFQKNYWAHFAPDGHTPWDFVLGSGYSYEFAGENLAKNFLFSKNVVDAWMQSPTHRDNLLRPQYTEVGYAVVNGVLNGEQTTLVVQIFGKPSNIPLADRPTSAPIPPEEQIEQNPADNVPQILSSQKVVQASVPKSSVYFVGLFILFLTLIVMIDLYVASRMNIIRAHGKSLAHLIFLVAVFFGVLLFITKGAII